MDDGAADDADGPLPVAEGLDAAEVEGGVIGGVEDEDPPAMGGVGVVSETGVGLGLVAVMSENFGKDGTEYAQKILLKPSRKPATTPQTSKGRLGPSKGAASGSSAPKKG